jgi:hypothetical protein
LRHKVDWIVDFIHCSALAYRCKECLKCNATVPPKLTERPESKEQAVNMDTVKQTIANLETKVQYFHEEVIAKLNTYSNDVSKAVVKQQKPPPFTYAAAAAVSADVLKSVVAETIREQQKATTNSSCLVVNGFPEESKDYTQLVEMLSYLQYKCDIICCSRIGHQKGSKIRPIKVCCAKVFGMRKIYRRVI